MNPEPTHHVLLVANHRPPLHHDSALEQLAIYLDQIPALSVTKTAQLPGTLDDYQSIVVTASADLAQSKQETLANFARAGGGVLALVGLDERPLPGFFGVEPCKVGPVNELRVLFTEAEDQRWARMVEMAYLQGRYHRLRQRTDDVETLLYADWRFDHIPVLTQRTVGDGWAAATTLQDFGNLWLQQVLYRILRQSVTATAPKTLGVALLGYSPAVGRLHGTGAAETAGLDLHAICDLSPRRLAEAETDFPTATIHDSAEALANDDGVDLVIIATPPSSHAKLAQQLLDAGKHVVCEKPLAITVAETEAMLAAAERNGRFLGCHQNRRWDVDYMAVKAAVEAKRIGELFYMETFVGSFNHPCGYWHSHDAISGGTTYDWGAHYLDWTLSIIPETITGVICTRQNRVWHDVTNADQERIQLRFANGQEADFTHSDIAAVRKPKWYLLGTEGAIVGHWRDITSYEPDELRYFNEYPIPTTEIPPELWCHRRLQPDGEETSAATAERMYLPTRPTNAFHHNLANHLLTGEPIEVPATHSARVVALLEAATRSAAQQGNLQAVTI